MYTEKINLNTRKDLILGIVVERYTQTVNPVSSAYISKIFPTGISSATIRNALADLEEEGFLTHPHTSAGRLPTEKGYRYYVDHLMHEIQLLEEEKQRIKAEYERETRELEGLLQKTSQVLSEVTHYTSLVSVDGEEDKLYCRGTNLVVHYSEQDLRKIEKILQELEEKERLMEIINQNLRKKIDIYIGHEIACDSMDGCSLVVSSYKTRSGHSGRMAILGPTRMQYDRVVSALDYFSRLMEELF